MTSGTPSSDSRVRVGVFGGTGYTGGELLRLLADQEHVEIGFATSRSSAATPAPVAGLVFVHPDEAPLSEVELVFLCLPHGEAAGWVDAFGGDVPIVDLTADHRPGSGRESGWTYGLAERNADAVKGASRVANPGCYPTGVLLSLLPLREAGLVDEDRLTVVDAASGVTGAGRTPRMHLLFAEVTENYQAYGEGNEHRHLKEMRSLLPERSLLFQPHLLPVARGILETITLPVNEGVEPEDVRRAWKEAYSGSSVVEVLESGLPDLSRVIHTDRLSLGVSDVSRIVPPVVTVVAAFDNLGKGAAGQALQNMNLMWGWPIDRGLRC